MEVGEEEEEEAGRLLGLTEVQDGRDVVSRPLLRPLRALDGAHDMYDAYIRKSGFCLRCLWGLWRIPQTTDTTDHRVSFATKPSSNSNFFFFIAASPGSPSLPSLPFFNHALARISFPCWNRCKHLGIILQKADRWPPIECLF